MAIYSNIYYIDNLEGLQHHPPPFGKYVGGNPQENKGKFVHVTAHDLYTES